MKYDESEIEEETFETPNNSELTPQKIIQLHLNNSQEPPSVSYTDNVSVSEVVGALELALETLKTIHIQDKLKKKRLQAAYSDL